MVRLCESVNQLIHETVKNRTCRDSVRSTVQSDFGISSLTLDKKKS